MRLLFLLLACFPLFPLAAQPTLNTDARLTAATVYRSGVEMDHKAQIDLPVGSSEIIIGNVSGTVIDNTIQVGANANITILSVSFSKNYLKPEAMTEAHTRLEDSLKKTGKLISRLEDELTTDNSVLKLLETNSLKVGNNTGLSVAELIKLTDYYKNKQNEVKKNIAAIEEQQEVLEDKKDQLQHQLAELSADKHSATGTIILQVMAKVAATTDFRISYVSPEAGWSAFYDLRSDNTSDPLKLAYKANVVQNTGLNWNKVKLTLSTGNPTISGTAPSISPWMLSYKYQSVYGKVYDKRSLTDIATALEGAAPGVYVGSGGGQPGTTQDIQIRGQNTWSAGGTPLIVLDGAAYSGTLESISPNDVESMTVLKDASATGIYGSRGANGVILVTTRNKTLSQFTTASENVLAATFDIAISYNIASNNKPHSVSLQDYELPVQYQYFAIPKMDQDAFLMAHITQFEKLNLLPGLANIIFENMYVGNSYINPAITTDTLKLSMGRDKKIIIKREKVAALSGLKLSGNSQKQTYTFDIQVRNGKQETIDLVLKDQIPVATEKDMEIELVQSDDGQLDKETGMLTWNLKLKAGQSQKIRISYTVKHPANKPIANL